MQDRRWWLVAALSGALVVIAGAFAAHALEGQLTPRLAAAFETGVRYQAWHTLALMAVLAWRSSVRLPGQRLAMGLWAAGIALFSGSLYAMALSGVTRLGVITPIGGTLMIGGWLALASAILRASPRG
ncbi:MULTISPECIES: DUF423 domain-containing protein [unclassified Halomonas]|uniref:DUF423 domain-containing protein n=1 Tax=unclassified Halomonas TaxID=2609666 RepID=UPI0028855E64|nr:MULTISPECIES: DUF423 domain-containing protein [unclassified Halomonas]MDT0500106.1 DUF423 domain-containing protein [Halomonas sp. PAR7]MDT0512510.1 DUF423 domain-containing protein [Halomonas sp. LES1]MDT0591144.1 DUF423 domain-containing protein [Halomonas sp. PAR8]